MSWSSPSKSSTTNSRLREDQGQGTKNHSHSKNVKYCSTRSYANYSGVLTSNSKTRHGDITKYQVKPVHCFADLVHNGNYDHELVLHMFPETRQLTDLNVGISQ